MTADRAIVVGADEYGLGDALENRGVSVVGLPGPTTREGLREAGVVEADLLVVTEATLATAIPVARELAEGIRVVVYAGDTVPEFVRGQPALIVDPALMGADTVAEELVD
jgi:hypothetical protein